ncbi:hypothetical protein C0Q70_03101 [Pomacea canaliculata]|uniref:Uncharacterized protein n=1 Tax=Pomacea canaliculata TaxID=400727 RepID=A0A2T7PRT3_POMCA|nr:hypothetical protein C0Q70_03101 [Pomacea canaliculata]
MAARRDDKILPADRSRPGLMAGLAPCVIRACKASLGIMRGVRGGTPRRAPLCPGHGLADTISAGIYRERLPSASQERAARGASVLIALF